MPYKPICQPGWQALPARIVLISLLIFGLALPGPAQQSILVNFGSTTCTNALAPGFSIIRQPLTANPVALAHCSMTAQLPDYYSTFVAYNPADNKLYVCDNRTLVQSKTWKIDLGLPQRIACPASIPTAPDFLHSYVPNNYEFDNDGNLWSLAAYNPSTDQCRMDKFDVENGTVINTRTLQFPAGNFPSTIQSGDLAILPNGRMFATLGINPSRLYEILDYSSTSGNASAVFLQTLPKNCYGIAYLNGELEITGSDLASQCYAYRYAISANTLGPEQPFQLGLGPIDNTSFTPALGTTKQLVHGTLIDASTADLTYEVYLQNMGNVILNDVNIEENLEDAFGAGNVSNVQVEFAPGGNPAGLVLSPSYNGITQTSMLNGAQSLPNRVGTASNYFMKLLLHCRVKHLQPGTVYYNAVIGKATINNEVFRIYITDSSNNGSSTMVDPDNDGNAGGVGENTPTPFSMGVLPVKFAGMQAARQGDHVQVQWKVATPVHGAAFFEPQFSKDGGRWQALAKLPVSDHHQQVYGWLHENAPTSVLFYRIRQVDLDGKYLYSSVASVPAMVLPSQLMVYPNPVKANSPVFVRANMGATLSAIGLFDANGRLLRQVRAASGLNRIATAGLPGGLYYLHMQTAQGLVVQKLTIVP